MTKKMSPIDFARWSGYENRDGPVLVANFPVRPSSDALSNVHSAEAFLMSLIRAEAGNTAGIISDRSHGTRHVRVEGTRNCAILINWAANHKPALLEKLAKTEILPEVMASAQARIAGGSGNGVAAQPEATSLNGHAANGRKTAIHFATWSQFARGRQPVLVAAFTGNGYKEGSRRYEQAKEFFAASGAVDAKAVTLNPTALSIEIKGAEACRGFLGWVAEHMPEEKAALEASGIAAQLNGTHAKKRVAPEQLCLAAVDPAGWAAKQEKGRRGTENGGVTATR